MLTFTYPDFKINYISIVHSVSITGNVKKKKIHLHIIKQGKKANEIGTDLGLWNYTDGHASNRFKILVVLVLYHPETNC